MHGTRQGAWLVACAGALAACSSSSGGGTTGTVNPAEGGGPAPEGDAGSAAGGDAATAASTGGSSSGGTAAPALGYSCAPASVDIEGTGISGGKFDVTATNLLNGGGTVVATASNSQSAGTISFTLQDGSGKLPTSGELIPLGPGKGESAIIMGGTSTGKCVVSDGQAFVDSINTDGAGKITGFAARVAGACDPAKSTANSVTACVSL